MPVIFDARQLYDRIRPFLRPICTEGEEGQGETFPSPLEVPAVTMTTTSVFYYLRLLTYNRHKP